METALVVPVIVVKVPVAFVCMFTLHMTVRAMVVHDDLN